MDYIFQKFCNFFPHYKFSQNKKLQKIFYIIFCFFRLFLNGPFIINFKNFKFYCYPDKNDYSKYILTRGQMPDPKEIDILNMYINNQDSIFIDCGANAGFYTIPISSFNKKCTTISFEPSNIEFKKLNANIKLNSLKNIITEKIAVSNKVKDLIYREQGMTAKSFSSGAGHIVDKILDKKLDYKIKAITIDSYFKKFKIKRKTKMIMKFDLEGHDLKAIYGATKTINKYQPLILFEFSKWIINDPEYSKKKFNNFLKKNNLVILNLHKKTLNVNMLHQEINKLDKEHDTIGNLIILKKNNLKKIKFF